jgi:translation initiation factor IF-3
VLEFKYRANEKIRAKNVRVIDENGANLGIMPLYEALKLARNRDLDLVEVNPNADPPVCKILDYGRFKYELKKKEKQTKRVQIQTKEIKLRPIIDKHDFEIKLERAKEFLKDGNKVLITITFRAREIAYKQLGQNLLTQARQYLADVSKVERDIRSEGLKMSLILAPVKKEEKKDVKTQDMQSGKT